MALGLLVNPRRKKQPIQWIDRHDLVLASDPSLGISTGLRFGWKDEAWNLKWIIDGDQIREYADKLRKRKGAHEAFMEKYYWGDKGINQKDLKFLMDTFPDKKHIMWVDRGSNYFIIERKGEYKLQDGDRFESLNGFLPVERRPTEKESQRFDTGQLFFDNYRDRYLIFYASQSDLEWKQDLGYHILPEDDIESIRHHWSFPFCYTIQKKPSFLEPDDIQLDELDLVEITPENEDEFIISSQYIMYQGKAKFPYLIIAHPLLNIHQFNGIMDEFDNECWYDELSNRYGGYDSYSDDEDDEEGPGPELEEDEWCVLDDEEQEEEYEILWGIATVPVKLKDQVLFGNDELWKKYKEIPKSKALIQYDPMWPPLGWWIGLIPGDKIDVLKGPFLKIGDKVTFKSGNNGEGAILAGTIKSLNYCDLKGKTMVKDKPELKKFPWKYVKLSEYLGTPGKHYGTIATIHGDDGDTYHIGGKWIFPPHEGGQYIKPPEVIKPPTEPPVLPPTTPTKITPEKIVPVPPEKVSVPLTEIVVPPSETEHIVPPPPPEQKETEKEEPKPKKKRKRAAAQSYELEAYA